VVKLERVKLMPYNGKLPFYICIINAFLSFDT
jgi:hypothetical protein